MGLWKNDGKYIRSKAKSIPNLIRLPLIYISKDHKGYLSCDSNIPALLVFCDDKWDPHGKDHFESIHQDEKAVVPQCPSPCSHVYFTNGK